jgi:hypothetical protein
MALIISILNTEVVQRSKMFNNSLHEYRACDVVQSGTRSQNFTKERTDFIFRDKT